jgi:hypothetical protein
MSSSSRHQLSERFSNTTNKEAKIVRPIAFLQQKAYLDPWIAVHQLIATTVCYPHGYQKLSLVVHRVNA